MKETKKNPITKWEISILEIENNEGRKYKVTRKLSDLVVSETKVFNSKQEALKQFNEWLK
mgnify:CR=1 FL=1